MDYLSIACESYFLCKSITKFVINSRCFRCVRSAGRVITIQHIVMNLSPRIYVKIGILSVECHFTAGLSFHCRHKFSHVLKI